jgi:hypothetical protein
MIPVRTIASVLDQYTRGLMPDFLTIDTEGLDEEILRSLDWTRHRPKVVCVESLSFSPRLGEGTKNTSLISYIVAQGFRVFADTHINTIFIEDAFLGATAQRRPLSS